MWKDVLIAGWFAILATMLLGFRAYTKRSGRRIAESSSGGVPEQSHAGSMRWTRKLGFGGGSVNGPLGKLSLFDWGVRLAPSAVYVRPFVPTVELRFDEIASVGIGTSQTVPSHCVEIRAPAVDYYLVFWTSHAAQILEGFERHGVAVEHAPRPFHTLSWPDR